MHRDQKPLHAFAHVSLFARGMREQLDGRDIGIAVHHPPGHHRARVGLGLADAGDARNDPPQEQPVKDAPAQKRQRQPAIGRGRKDQRADEIDADIDQHVHELHRHLAHGQCGLHQLGGDPAGEFVLKIAHRLAQQIAMRLPADALGHVAHQRLVHDQRKQHLQQRQADDKDRAHQQQAPALIGPEAGAVRPRQPVHELAQIAKEHHLGHRDQRRARRHGQHVALGPLREMQDEAPEARRGHLRRIGGIGIKPLLEPAKHRETSEHQ